MSARLAWAPGRAARTGFLALAAGTAGTILVTVETIPLWVIFLTCALSGFGIGVVFNTTSVTAMRQARAGQEGLIGSQLGVADALGFALVGAVGGAMVGVADRGVLELSTALGIVFAMASAVALLGVVIAPRVRTATV
jgi:hypothetical protein